MKERAHAGLFEMLRLDVLEAHPVEVFVRPVHRWRLVAELGQLGWRGTAILFGLAVIRRGETPHGLRHEWLGDGVLDDSRARKLAAEPLTTGVTAESGALTLERTP